MSAMTMAVAGKGMAERAKAVVTRLLVHAAPLQRPSRCWSSRLARLPGRKLKATSGLNWLRLTIFPETMKAHRAYNAAFADVPGGARRSYHLEDEEIVLNQAAA